MPSSKYIIKWLIMVWLSAILSFAYGLQEAANNPLFIAGMVLGVCVFAIPYAMLDQHAQKMGFKDLANALQVSVIIKMVGQILILPELFAGAMAIEVSNKLFSGFNPPFFYVFITTILTGIFLSIIVALLTIIVSIIMKAADKTDKKIF